jgi:hypothetical protein
VNSTAEKKSSSHCGVDVMTDDHFNPAIVVGKMARSPHLCCNARDEWRGAISIAHEA